MRRLSARLSQSPQAAAASRDSNGQRAWGTSTWSLPTKYPQTMKNIRRVNWKKCDLAEIKSFQFFSFPFSSAAWWGDHSARDPTEPWWEASGLRKQGHLRQRGCSQHLRGHCPAGWHGAGDQEKVSPTYAFQLAGKLYPGLKNRSWSDGGWRCRVRRQPKGKWNKRTTEVRGNPWNCNDLDFQFEEGISDFQKRCSLLYGHP